MSETPTTITMEAMTFLIEEIGRLGIKVDRIGAPDAYLARIKTAMVAAEGALDQQVRDAELHVLGACAVLDRTNVIADGGLQLMKGIARVGL